MNKMDFYEENYYSPQTGYVLEGKRMSRDNAVKMICHSWYFSTSEAVTYLDRLVRAFNSRVSAIRGGAA